MAKSSGAHREFYEAALHKALEINNTGGPIVSGDAKNQEKEWPDDFQKNYLNNLLEETIMGSGSKYDYWDRADLLDAVKDTYMKLHGKKPKPVYMMSLRARH